MQLVGAEAESERCVIVECQDDDMTRVAKLLAEQEQVHWVDRYMPIRTRAFHAAHNSRETELRVDVSAVWARGINGSGEVVHVADSGVDVGHCLFHDPNVAVPYNRVDMLHRKVCIDIYIYIYIYTYMYAYTHTYTYREKKRERERKRETDRKRERAREREREREKEKYA